MIVFSDGAEADLERIYDFNAEHDPALALAHLDTIQSAVMLLDVHPDIGRRTKPKSRLRELVISQGASGYVALYEYYPADDLIVIHAVRHQREAGYLPDTR